MAERLISRVLDKLPIDPRRAAALTGAAATMLLLAACGSQSKPSTRSQSDERVGVLDVYFACPPGSVASPRKPVEPKGPGLGDASVSFTCLDANGDSLAPQALTGSYTGDVPASVSVYRTNINEFTLAYAYDAPLQPQINIVPHSDSSSGSVEASNVVDLNVTSERINISMAGQP